MHTLAEFPPRTETTDANGVTTIVEYRLNDDGKRVKVTRRIKRTLVKKHVNHVVAERMHWKKWAGRGFGFGAVKRGN
jgi:translation initiation factor 3 subunit G